MKSFFVVLLAVIAVTFVVAGEVVYSESDINEWNNFKTTHGKTYDGAEDRRRMQIYIDNRSRVAEHNKKFANGEVSYKQGINQFSDQLPEEVPRGGFRKPSTAGS